MFIEEARWLNTFLREIEPQKGWTLLDVGSSTEYFRRVQQPYIDYYVFRPLRKLGVKVLHVDARADEGVDIVCDISDPGSQALVDSLPRADIVLCSNLLEHVLDREMVISRLAEMTKPEGYLIVTVPYIYHYHEDPIDTMYRPTNTELEAAFPLDTYKVTRSEILDVDCGYLDAPERFLPYIAFRIRRVIQLSVLRREVKFDRCKVSVVVLRKVAPAQTPGLA